MTKVADPPAAELEPADKIAEKQGGKPTKPDRKSCTQYAPKTRIAELTNPDIKTDRTEGRETR